MSYFIFDKDKNLKEVSILEWSNWFNNLENRRVAFDTIGNKEVSTILLGFLTSGDYIFETAILDGINSEVLDKYKTYDEALEGHRRIVDEMIMESCNEIL